MRERVVLGLSGGVDSAVAAELLSRQYDVYCVYLDIGLEERGKEDAAAVAARLKLPFEAVDIRETLEENVCASFVADYLAGRTPLPCARCNTLVKFPTLFAAADRVGARYAATGHYARTGKGPDGRTLLRKGLPGNDQSYMLARLTKGQLARVLFPLGELEKKQVRALAGQSALPVADKPDSMELCFVPDQDYAAWLERRGAVPPPGDFVDKAGRVLGRHGGIHRYTLGQGRGLSVPGPHRYFVTAIDPVENKVVLSDGSDLLTSRAFCAEPNWLSVDALNGPTEVAVRLRHSKSELPATIFSSEKGVTIELKTPARAPTPGQLAVFYQNEVVLGSAWLTQEV